MNTDLVIPAGAVNYEVTAKLQLPPGKVITVMPHMHLLGRQTKVEVQDRDGTKRPIIYIYNRDFNWQGYYVPVGWGERTSDEMCVALIGVIFDNEGNLPLPFSVSRR